MAKAVYIKHSSFLNLKDVLTYTKTFLQKYGDIWEFQKQFSLLFKFNGPPNRTHEHKMKFNGRIRFPVTSEIVNSTVTFLLPKDLIDFAGNDSFKPIKPF